MHELQPPAAGPQDTSSPMKRVLASRKTPPDFTHTIPRRAKVEDSDESFSCLDKAGKRVCTRTVEPHKDAEPSDHLAEGWTEETVYAPGRGLEKLVQRFGNRVSMQWDLVEFTPAPRPRSRKLGFVTKELTHSDLTRMDRVVPVAMKRMGLELDLGHLGIADADAFRVAPGIDLRPDP